MDLENGSMTRVFLKRTVCCRNLCSLILFFIILSWHQLAATPLIALREAQNCGGCHKPGRSQRPVLERRCTLDCQGCHIQPDGGGARNQWGRYYSDDQLAWINFRVPDDPLKDQSRFDLHTDFRVIEWIRADGITQTFPMNSEHTLRLRPFKSYLHLTYTNLLMGRIEDRLLRVPAEDGRRYQERYSIMLDSLPFNTYVRAYKGTPMYGLKRPNHTLWIRQRIGLDQFATTEALEVGGTPNVPFFRASAMRGDPNVPKQYRQVGSSYHFGMRGVSYGWHLNGSGWATRSEFQDIRMQAAGGGFQLFSFLVYGERNWRDVGSLQQQPAAVAPRVYPSSSISEYTLAFAGIRGLMLGAVQEDMNMGGLISGRTSFFLDLHPIPYVQIEIWRRREYGARHQEDTLGILHLYVSL